MAYCPNCGTEYQQVPVRCQCGYLFSAGGGTITPEPPAAEAKGRFEFTGDGFALALLYFKLAVFSILTLGIYSFWGRTAIRRYLWGNTRFAGQPLAYHGTALEMLRGWLLFAATIAVIYAVFIGGAVYLGQERSVWPGIGLTLVSALLMPFAIHGAIRYRWSRTSWQGRRFSYRGEFWPLASIFWTGAVLSILTLSIYLPVFLANLRRYVLANSWYGGQAFSFSGDGKELLWPYAKFLLLFLPTLTIYQFWYKATQTNYFWGKSEFAGVPFRSTVSGGGFFSLAITNAILVFFTFGIAYPWAVCRQIRYVFANLELERLPRVQLLEQSADPANAFGDALGNALGTDAGIDAGFGL